MSLQGDSTYRLAFWKSTSLSMWFTDQGRSEGSTVFAPSTAALNTYQLACNLTQVDIDWALQACKSPYIHMQKKPTHNSKPYTHTLNPEL